MSRAPEDAQNVTASLWAGSARGPFIELVSTTGARDLAVLVYRSADVDETAFAPRDPTSPRVYGLAVRITGSPSGIEKVARASCREVWRTSICFDADRSSAMAWIMAIAHRRAVDRLRTSRDTTAPSTPTSLGPVGRRARRNARQDRHTRNDQATHAEVAQVRQALSLLDPAECEALELVYFERYSAAAPNDLATIMSTLVTTRLPHDPDLPETLAPQVVPGWPPDRAAS